MYLKTVQIMIITTVSLEFTGSVIRDVHLTFNGVSMFYNYNSEESAESVFNDMAQDLALDNTMSIFTSSDGSTGPKVSINKALLLSALTIEADDLDQTDNTSRNQWSVVNAFNTAAARSTTQQYTFASTTYAGNGFKEISVGVFTPCLGEFSHTRADNEAIMSSLQYASDNATLQAKTLPQPMVGLLMWISPLRVQI